MRHPLLICLLALAGFAAGCSQAPWRRDAHPPLDHSPGPLTTETASPESPGTLDAVVLLVGRADRASAEGDTEQAAALLERAIRLDPSDALAWNRLAALRLEDRQWQQAEQLAVRSNRLAGDSDTLRVRNWRIIAASLRARGLTAEARNADREADRLADR